MNEAERILYKDTRGSEKEYELSEAVLTKTTETGGLLVPTDMPYFSQTDLNELAQMGSYQDIVKKVLNGFAPDFSEEEISQIVDLAYSEKNFDTSEIVPVKEVREGVYVMELFHGPTSAFKDMALQIMPIFFSKAVEKNNEKRQEQGKKPQQYVILVATSGDTGKAALEGFKDRDHVKIVVFYPHDGVSDLQETQMLTQEGDNTYVYSIRGNFDDAQGGVKEVFSDEKFNAELEETFGAKLSSANSINWGRILPQIIYYLHMYANLLKNEEISEGEMVDVAVPTGNFGNILAAFYAKQMGIPIDRLVCAANENKILADFIETGKYDVRERALVKTPSPSMDILVASNLERLLFELTQNPGQVKQWMESLRSNKFFEVDEKTHGAIQSLFYTGSSSNQETLEEIKRSLDEDHYLMDPHTAVASHVTRQYQTDVPSHKKVVIVSTAQWAKFGEDVFKAIQGIRADVTDIPELQGLSGVEVLNKVVELLPDANIPQNLALLDQKDIVHPREPIDGTCEAVKTKIREVLEASRDSYIH